MQKKHIAQSYIPIRLKDLGGEVVGFSKMNINSINILDKLKKEAWYERRYHKGR